MQQPFEISFEDGRPSITCAFGTSAAVAAKAAQAQAVELPGVLVTLSRGGRKIASWAQPPDADAGERARQERTRQAEARMMADYLGPRRDRAVTGVNGVSIERNISFLLGRAASIIEGLVESPTDAIDIRMAEEFLAGYRKWLEEVS